MTDDVLYKYFTDVAEAVSTPCLVYNAPQYAGGLGLSLANSFPLLTVELYELLAGKKYAEAIALNERILQISKIVGGKGGVAAVKYAMDLNGLAGGEPRLPLLPLDETEKEKIRNKLESEKLISKSQ